MLQCVTVCGSVLQCVAVRCCAMLCDAVRCSVLQCVAVCCSAMQCDAVHCSVLQCVAVCRSVFATRVSRSRTPLQSFRLQQKRPLFLKEASIFNKRGLYFKQNSPPSRLYFSLLFHLYSSLLPYLYISTRAPSILPLSKQQSPRTNLYSDIRALYSRPLYPTQTSILLSIKVK